MPTTSPPPESQDTSPGWLQIASARVRALRNQITGRVAHAAVQTTDNPIPITSETLNPPSYVTESWQHCQRHLSPEKQTQVSYYEKNSEWFITINGVVTGMPLQNTSTPSDPSNGVNVVGGNTYFSQSAAQSLAKSTRRALPSKALWESIANFFGGFEHMQNILSIPFNGWFHPEVGPQGLHGGYVWSDDDTVCLYVVAGGGYVGYSAFTSGGYSVRLLDKPA